MERMASAWRPRMAAGVGSREGPCSPHFGAGAQRRQWPRPRPPHRRSKRSGHGDGPGSHTQGPSCRIPRAATTASRMSCTCRRLRASSDLGVLDVRHVSGDGARQAGRDGEGRCGFSLSVSIKIPKKETRFRNAARDVAWNHTTAASNSSGARNCQRLHSSCEVLSIYASVNVVRGVAHILCANCQILFTEHISLNMLSTISHGRGSNSIDRSSPLPYTRHP